MTRKLKLVLLLILCCATVSLFCTYHSMVFTDSHTTLQLCPEVPPDLVGPIQPDLRVPELEELFKMNPKLEIGGHWKPETCKARKRVAIIVPYRDREEHLRIFLKNLHPLLQKQQLDYKIFIVDQSEDQVFNRAKLMNVGFVEAQKLDNFDCFIFHDVDLIPENDKNMYSCVDYPKHMAVAVDKFNYNLTYKQCVGGVIAFTGEQLEKINGFSNDYWGWGGEDDDLYKRIIYSKLRIFRDDMTIARYKMIKHERDKANPANNCASKQTRFTVRRWKKDGLSRLNYTLLSINKEPLFTILKADLLEEESKEKLRKEEPTYVIC
ncbi:hypothetical protein L596_024783 [Steinernema carpocapsae]|uniref:Beta-1,4-N-acetylgalactosaminyltransferase n=1 Tax=Steinernema carpocapsae TaxID=34508 RepID=A0A4U5M5T0_STECR|nr:hypothetical protein L596_024783 [Steinernema carpocapsae]